MKNHRESGKHRYMNHQAGPLSLQDHIGAVANTSINGQTVKSTLRPIKNGRNFKWSEERHNTFVSNLLQVKKEIEFYMEKQKIDRCVKKPKFLTQSLSQHRQNNRKSLQTMPFVPGLTPFQTKNRIYLHKNDKLRFNIDAEENIDIWSKHENQEKNQKIRLNEQKKNQRINQRQTIHFSKNPKRSSSNFFSIDLKIKKVRCFSQNKKSLSNSKSLGQSDTIL